MSRRSQIIRYCLLTLFPRAVASHADVDELYKRPDPVMNLDAKFALAEIEAAASKKPAQAAAAAKPNIRLTRRSRKLFSNEAAAAAAALPTQGDDESNRQATRRRSARVRMLHRMDQDLEDDLIEPQPDEQMLVGHRLSSSRSSLR